VSIKKDPYQLWKIRCHQGGNAETVDFGKGQGLFHFRKSSRNSLMIDKDTKVVVVSGMATPQRDLDRSDLLNQLHSRYGAPIDGLPETAPNSDVLGTLLSHRSVRAYRPDPLPSGTLELLIAAAQSAASSANLQAFSVVAVQEPARKARLAALCRDQKHIHEAPLFLVWLADLSRLKRVSESVGSDAKALDFLECFLLAVIDATLAAQNAVVAAESLGLGTVYIGALRNQPELVSAELALPPHVLPVFGLVVGYPDPARPAAVKPRLPVEAVLHREQYSVATEPALLTTYDGALAAFQATQGLPPIGWTQTAAKRVSSGDALGSRVHLANAVAKLGLKLT
jgi:nitroreductase